MNEFDFLDTVNAAVFIVVALIVALCALFALLSWVADWLMMRDVPDIYPEDGGLDFVRIPRSRR